MDETVLLWKDPPPSPPDMQINDHCKDNLTIITCTNMDATHKLSLNIVGKYAEPVTEGGGLSSPRNGHSVGQQTEATSPSSLENLMTSSTAVASETIQDMGEVVQANDATPSSDDVTSIETSETPQPPPPILLYRKGDTHELTGDIFADWFYSTFVPQVKVSLAARGLPPQAVLILDNSLYHASPQLTDSSGKIKTIRVPCYVANKSLPSATISKSLKLRYKIRLAQEWIKDKEFCKNLNLRR